MNNARIVYCVIELMWVVNLIYLLFVNQIYCYLYVRFCPGADLNMSVNVGQIYLISFDCFILQRENVKIRNSVH